jgi:hypothetical protein
MAGLDPAMHISHRTERRGVDARVKRRMRIEIFSLSSVGSGLARSSIGQTSILGDQAMPTHIATIPVSKSALYMGRLVSGFVILFMLFDGAIKLVPWPIVTETMDRMGYGSSETVARSLGIISIVSTLLYSFPPTSFVGAILMTGYLGGAVASHVRLASPLFTNILFGVYLGAMLWGGLWLRDRTLRAMLPLAS